MLHTNTRTEYVGFEDERMREERMREKMGARETGVGREEMGRTAEASEVHFSDLVNKSMDLGAASARYTWNLMMWPMREAMNMVNHQNSAGRKV